MPVCFIICMDSSEGPISMLHNKCPFYKIVLTGGSIHLFEGPCGGKTSVQAILSDTFENMGWKVYRVPETASILLGSGVVFDKLSAKEANEFQRHLLNVLMQIESTYFKLAKLHADRGLKTIVICDRGTMDPSAYMGREEWIQLVKDIGCNEISLRDERYDCVVHMVSAACGAEEHYNKDSTQIRSEGIELARKLDNSVLNAWIGHPYYEIVDNRTGFEEKLNRVVQCVLKRLGLNDNRSGANVLKAKFLLTDYNPDQIPAPFRDFEVQHNYLVTTDDTRVRIRKRGFDNCFAYTMTTTTEKFDADGHRVETRRSLSSREYEALQLQLDQTRASIVKKRKVFLYKNCYFHIDQFESPRKGLVIMEAYLPSDLPNDDFLPPFVTVKENITGVKDYSMYEMARIDE